MDLKNWLSIRCEQIGFGGREDWKRFGNDMINYLLVSLIGVVPAIVDWVRGVDPFELQEIMAIEVTVLVVAPFITVFGNMSSKERAHKFILAFALPIIFGTVAAALLMYKTQSVCVWMCFVLAYLTLVAFGGSSPQSRETRWGEAQPLLEDLPCLDALLRVLRKFGEKDVADEIIHALLEHRSLAIINLLMGKMTAFLREISKDESVHRQAIERLREGAINDVMLWAERLPRRGGLDPKIEDGERAGSNPRRRKHRHQPRGLFRS